MTVPVIAASIINRPDLLDRMWDTVDEPAERKLVVDNGHTGYRREGVTVCEPPFNSMGWAGTFNYVIAQTPDAPWWLYVNNDAYFEPGILARLVERMGQADGPLVVTDGYTVTAINRQVIERVGLFDEWSFYPIYFEDTDFSRRCHLEGVPIEHGKWCLEGDIGQTDVPSLTIKSDATLALANNRTWQLNEQAYAAKWGGIPGEEKFTTPWNSGLPVWAVKPDIRGRHRRLW